MRKLRDNTWTKGKHKAEGREMRSKYGKRKQKAKVNILGRAVQRAKNQGRKVNRLVNEMIANMTAETKLATNEQIDKARMIPRTEKKYMNIPNWLLRDSKEYEKCKITYPGRRKADLEALEEIYGIDLRIGEQVHIMDRKKQWPRWMRERDAQWKAEREKEDQEDMELKAAAGQVIEFPRTKKEKAKEEKMQKREVKKQENVDLLKAAQELYEKMYKK